MKFEQKMSGTKVTDYDIIPLFNSQYISLESLLKMDLKQKTMDFILDSCRFSKEAETEEDEDKWWCILDWDSIYKLSCIENYPEYVKEFEEYFGKNWLKHYIRFNH